MTDRQLSSWISNPRMTNTINRALELLLASGQPHAQGKSIRELPQGEKWDPGLGSLPSQ